MIDIRKLAEKYSESLIKSLQDLLKFRSVYDDMTVGVGAPFGKGIKDSLDYMLKLAQNDGFQTLNDDGYVGVIKYGQGEPFAILGHLDVVPEGKNWSYPPYGGVIANGRIYGRGALDDKGPTLAAYYALKMLKDAGVQFKREIQLILGTDEETAWRGISHYQEKYQLPDEGFAPDADFPIIYGEKGILRLTLTGKKPDSLTSLNAGERFNVVIDEATWTIDGKEYTESGVSAHAMEPFKGENAGTKMALKLSEIPLMNFVGKYFHNDFHLTNLGFETTHPELGKITSNIGFIKIDGDSIVLGVDIRYPIGFSVESFAEKLCSLGNEYAFKLTVVENKLPHYQPLDSHLVMTLYTSYIKYTNDTVNPPKTIGGGTYARALKRGVAFGMEMPGVISLVHQKDESVDLEDLVTGMVIYADAIYQIGCVHEKKK